MKDEEILLNALYKNVKDYTEIIELIENLIYTFQGYFGQDSSNGQLILEIENITEHSIYDFHKFKEKFIEVFHDVLFKERLKQDKDFYLDKRNILSLSDNIKKLLEDTLFIYQHEFLLEITTFLKINKIQQQLEEDIKLLVIEGFTNNLNVYYESIELCSEKLHFLLEDTVHEYEVFIWGIRKLLLEEIKRKDSLEKAAYVDRTLSMREKFINTTDNLKSSLVKDVEYLVMAYFIENIRSTLLVTLEDKLKIYKELLSKNLELQKKYEQKDKTITISYEFIDSKIEMEIYKMCRELFLSQYNYLKKIFSFSKVRFETLTAEIEYKLNTIFNSEFEEPIYFINTEEDFDNICDILKEKFNFIIYSFIMAAFTHFKADYYDSIKRSLDRKKVSLESAYSHKLIVQFISHINSYNNSTKIILYNKLEELYKSYDSEEILCGDSIPVILNLYNFDEVIPKKFFKEYIYNSIDCSDIFLKYTYNNAKDINDKKAILYEKVVEFRKKLWDTLYNELISYFDYILPNLGRNMDYVKKQADYYGNKVSENK